VAEDITPTTTGASLSAMAPGAVRQLWNKGVQVAEQSEDFFQQFESSGKNAVIRVETDTAAGRGQKITFTNLSGFYKEGKLGDERFDSQDDFEKARVGSYDLKVDWIRHAYSINERAEEVMGMRGEIQSGLNVELGKWLGRRKSELMFAEFQLNLATSNILYASGKTLNTLSSADTLLWDEIVTGGQAMKPLGGRPANVGRGAGGQTIWSQVVVATEVALTSLKLDPDYKDALAGADERGKRNTLFSGGYRDIDGHVIAPYNPIDHDGVGAVGSFLNPKADLGVAVTAGTAAFDVKGGGNSTDAAETDVLFFKFFPGYAFKFIDLTTFAPAAGTNYFLIYNLTGADAGKSGMYSYANVGGNDGNKITVNGRLGSAASGIRATTLGDVTWNTGVWLNKHTDAHPEGSLVIPCNSKGVPVGDSLILGQRAAYRGYGKYRGKRSTQSLEGGHIEQRYITSVFGQTIGKDRKNRHTSVIRMRHAVSYPGINLPVVA
jgi:hypothetical protein